MAHLKDWQSLSKIDPEFDEALKAIGPLPNFSDFPSVPALRDALDQGRAKLSGIYPPPENVKESDHQAPMRDGTSITCRVYSPSPPPTGGSPLAVVYHGGGWCLGSLKSEELLCRRLASILGMTCVNVGYRLAPEHRFPVGVHDAIDAAKWAATNASTLGADPTKGFTVHGSSAGGGFAAIVAHTLRDEAFSPPITGCHLAIAIFCYPEALPKEFAAEEHSIKQNAQAPILNEKNMEFCLKNYITKKEDLYDPRLSPFLWPTGRKGLPPMYFQVCGLDPVRDQELIFERLLREEEGIATKVDVYQGLPHGFWFTFPELQASRKLVEDYITGVAWLLEQKK